MFLGYNLAEATMQEQTAALQGCAGCVVTILTELKGSCQMLTLPPLPVSMAISYAILHPLCSHKPLGGGAAAFLCTNTETALTCRDWCVCASHEGPWVNRARFLG